MIGVDTNVLVRFFVEDDARQSELARRFLKERTVDDPAFVSAVVMAELAWALKSNYGYDQERVYATLAVVLGAFNMAVEREKLMVDALSTARARNADLSDCIIAAIAQGMGCERTATFDKPAARDIPGMELLK